MQSPLGSLATKTQYPVQSRKARRSGLVTRGFFFPLAPATLRDDLSIALQLSCYEPVKAAAIRPVRNSRVVRSSLQKLLPHRAVCADFCQKPTQSLNGNVTRIRDAEYA